MKKYEHQCILKWNGESIGNGERIVIYSNLKTIPKSLLLKECEKIIEKKGPNFCITDYVIFLNK